MSININLVSDKPEFTNYFSESVVLPERAEIVMNKANMNIPIVKVVGITVPEVLLAARTDTCLSVLLDGIEINISWRDLFNAHTALAAEDIDEGVGENEYYSGEFQYLPNYPAYYIKLLPLPVEYKKKLNFMDVVAKAIDTKAVFYTVKNEANYEVLDQSKVFKTGGVEIIQDYAGNVLGVQNMMNGIQTANTLVAYYAPQKQIDDTLTVATIDASANSNFVLSAGNNTLTSAATGINQAWASNENKIDINGGWWQTTFTYGGTGTAVYGISLEGVGHGGDDYNPIAATFEPEVFDVGFQFETVGAKTCYKIIDGNKQHVYYDSGTSTEVTKTLPLYHPPNAKLEFNNGDRFFIQVQRGSIYNGTNEFIINLYQGFQTHDFNATAFTKLIYTSRRTINNPSIRPNIGFMTTNDAGHIFSGNSFMLRNDQTNAQSNHITSISGQYYTGTLTVTPIITDNLVNNTRVKQRNLWSAYGFSTLDINSTATNGRDFTSFVRSDRSLALERKTNFTSSNSIIRYHLGQSFIEDIYDYDVGGVGVTVDTQAGVSDLPQEFKVKIRNMPVKAFQGSFITSKNYSNTSGGEQRVIGTIPFPTTDEDSGNIDIKYEPFNLTYRPLNNVEPFMFNKLDVDIDFLDFNTNKRKTFSTVNGHLTLDLNVRQGALEPKLKNNMRPV